MIWGNSEKFGLTDEMLDMIGTIPVETLPTEKKKKETTAFVPIRFIEGLVPIPG